MFRRSTSVASHLPPPGSTARPNLRIWPLQPSNGPRFPVTGPSTLKRHLTDSPATPQARTPAHDSAHSPYHGACHCGNIHVHFHTSKTPVELGSRACQCSFCRMHGATFTSDPAGTLHITSTGPVTPYRCGTGTAEFWSCGKCGVVPAATWRRGDGELLSVVRVQCLDNSNKIRDELLKEERKWSVEHELERPEERLRRRERSWTPTIVERDG